jgi:hypothetical protein
MIYDIALWTCVAVLLQTAEPIIHIKRYFGFKEEEYDSMSKLKRLFHRLLYCATCLGFWVVLITTLQIDLAIITSVIAGLIHKIMLN